MISASETTGSQMHEEVLVLNALESRINAGFDRFQELNNGFIQPASDALCKGPWDAMIQCYTKTYHGEDTGADKHYTAEKDKAFTHERLMRSCAPAIDRFLSCAQKERVFFMKRLGDQIDQNNTEEST